MLVSAPERVSSKRTDLTGLKGRERLVLCISLGNLVPLRR